jgi:tight adherence protein B
VTRTGIFLILAPLLLAAMSAGAAILVGSRRNQRLRERISAQTTRGASLAAIADLPSIRVGRRETSPLVGRIFRVLRYHPDIPQEHVIPWVVVLLASLVVAAFAGFRAADLMGGLLAVPVALLAGLLVARAMFGWQHRRYCDAVFQQIPEALGLMVRAIRAGLPLAEALRSVTRELASPTRDEFTRVLGDMTIGRSVDVALMRVYERTGLTEFAFLAVTLGLQSQTGGSLAETLDNLADTVRKRVSLAKRAQALAGEAKVQAGLLIVLPFIAALAMSFSQPFYVSAFTENPTGQKLLMAGLGLMALGVVTIRWLIRKAGED